jgi:hypothetical protein
MWIFEFDPAGDSDWVDPAGLLVFNNLNFNKDQDSVHMGHSHVTSLPGSGSSSGSDQLWIFESDHLLILLDTQIGAVFWLACV